MAKRNVSGCFEVLVATPGRTLKLLEHNLCLTDVRVIVFDEADQMLDQGFLPTANRIVKACKKAPQMVLFSATISVVIQELMEKLFSNVQVIRSEGSNKVVPTLTTENEIVMNGERFPILSNLLKKPKKGGTLIFTNTRAQCDKVAEQLTANNFKCVVYRGEMDKLERRANLKKFQSGEVNLLISTDLAS